MAEKEGKKPKGEKPAGSPSLGRGGDPEGSPDKAGKPAAEGGAKPEKQAKAPKAPKPEKSEGAEAAVPAAAAAAGGEKPAKAEGEKPPKPEGERPARPGSPSGSAGRGGDAPKAEGGAEKAPKGERPAKGDKAAKKGKGEAAEGGEAPAAEGAPAKPAEKLPPPPPPRFGEKYKNEVRARMKTAFGYTNDYAVPKITKVVISMGVGSSLANPKRLEEAQKHLTQIAGQKAVVTKSRVSIANFRLRQGNAIGCKVTLRRARMYEFLDRLVSLAIPRIRDFRGLSPKAFDGRGNYSMGLNEQLVFPEIDADKVEFQQGMNIAVCTTARSDKEAFELLSGFGFPFRQA